MAKIKHMIEGQEVTPPETVLEWWHKISNDGYLVGFTDGAGREWSVLKIWENGVGHLLRGLPESSGLALDEEGRLIIAGTVFRLKDY